MASLIICALAACAPIQIQFTTGSYPPFIKTAEYGDIAQAEQLLRQGELVDQVTVGNQTALHIAATVGQDTMVMWLLAHDANPVAKDQHGNTPAYYARQRGYTDTEEIIFNHIKLLQSENQAIATGDIEGLRKLLLLDSRQYTVLHIAVQMGETAVVKSEISRGADVNAKTATGLTPLHKAVVSGNMEIAELLIQANADLNALDVYDNTPLYYAINAADEGLVRLFLSAGADPNIRSVIGNQNALEFAESRGNQEIITLVSGLTR